MYAIIQAAVNHTLLQPQVLRSQALRFCILLLGLHVYILLSWQSSFHSGENWQTARKKNPAAYPILHLFTIDPARFGLNGHHQGSQQSYQEPLRSLYVKM